MQALILASPPNLKPLWLGFSGGLDSCVLLHQLRQQFPQQKLSAIHVHHGLHNHADEWAQHCQRVCDRYQVDLHIERVQLQDSTRNIEQQARTARYQAFAERMPSGETLVLAHHADDVTETLLLRLMRGSGTAALANMQAVEQRTNFLLWRPLLTTYREELEKFAHINSLQWIEDPSNTNTRFDRNFIRHEILPLLNKKFPHANRRIAQSAHWLHQDAELIAPIIEQHLHDCQDGNTLCIQKLLLKSEAIQSHILRAWLKRQQQELPSAKTLHEFLRQLSVHQSDSATQLQTKNYCLRIWQNKLFVMNNSSEPFAPYHATWNGESPLILPRGGVLKWQGKAPFAMQVKYRVGGERIQLAGRGVHHSVKKCLAERVPTWLRDTLPFVYNDHGELLAVADVLLSDTLQEVQKKSNVQLLWHQNSEFTYG